MRKTKWIAVAALLLVGVFVVSACSKPDAPPTQKSEDKADAKIQNQTEKEKKDGMKMVKMKSAYSMDETVAKIEGFLKEKNITLFYVADHMKNAEEVGLTLAPTKVLSFGDPKVGTLLMQDNPEISFELPLKVAVFQNDEGVFVSYRKPTTYAEDYQLSEKSLEILKKMDGLYEAIGATLK